MPIVDPYKTGMPRDWRQPYDAFRKAKAIGNQIGEPVSQWKLEYPSGAKKLVDKRWRMTYTFRHKVYDIYLGTTGADSTKTINEVIAGLKSILEADRAVKAVQSQHTSKEVKRSPIYDDHSARSIFEEWNQAMRGIRSDADYQNFKCGARGKFLEWFMSRKAGILDMSMRAYLTNHPHARYWPSAPADKQQYDRRQREFEQIVRDKEKRRRIDHDE